MLRAKRRLLLVGALLALGGAAVGIAYATIPSGGVINGCYQKSNGLLRVVGTNPTVGGGACTNGEQPLSWSQQGPAGATGATGATGASGPPGPATAYFANVAVNGTLVASSPGVTAEDANGDGRYRVFFPVPVEDCGAVATIGFNGTGGSVPGSGGQTQADVSSGQGRVDVRTYDGDGTSVDASFHVVVVC